MGGALRLRLIAGLAACALVLGACGDDDESAEREKPKPITGLTLNSATQALTSNIRNNSRFGYILSSLSCQRVGNDRVSCDILFQDKRNDFWCGRGAAKLQPGGKIIRSTYRVSKRNRPDADASLADCAAGRKT